LHLQLHKSDQSASYAELTAAKIESLKLRNEPQKMLENVLQRNS